MRPGRPAGLDERSSGNCRQRHASPADSSLPSSEKIRWRVDQSCAEPAHALRRRARVAIHDGLLTHGPVTKSPDGQISGAAAIDSVVTPCAAEIAVGKARGAATSPLRRFLKILGPRPVTGASDDDPSGIGTYAMAGAAFGYSTLWTALVTFPLMAGVQYFCAKIGLVYGCGLAGIMRRHYS